MTPRPAGRLARTEPSYRPSRRRVKRSTKATGGAGDTLANAQGFPVTQRDLNIILAPGDITYKICGKPLSLYWDFAYNFTGDDRFNRDYGPLFSHYFYVGRSSTPSFSHPV